MHMTKDLATAADCRAGQRTNAVIESPEGLVRTMRQSRQARVGLAGMPSADLWTVLLHRANGGNDR